MGYSVGRWEGDTLVVDSFGFNDRTWLDARGLPHTEALRTSERYRAAERRPATGRAHRDRPWGVRQVVDGDLRLGVSGGHRDGRRRLRRSDPLDRPFIRCRAWRGHRCAGDVGEVRGRVQRAVGHAAADRSNSSSKTGLCTRTDYSATRCGSFLTPRPRSWGATVSPSTSIRREIRRRSWWSGTCPAIGATRGSRTSKAARRAAGTGGYCSSIVHARSSGARVKLRSPPHRLER